jgi:lipoprotein signal peptidase
VYRYSSVDVLIEIESEYTEVLQSSTGMMYHSERPLDEVSITETINYGTDNSLISQHARVIWIIDSCVTVLFIIVQSKWKEHEKVHTEQ